MTTSLYDANRRRVGTRDALGRNTYFAYDAAGRTLTPIYANGRRAQTT